MSRQSRSGWRALSAGIALIGSFFSAEGTITPALHAQEAASNPQITTETDCSKMFVGELGGDVKCELLKSKVLDSQINQAKDLRQQAKDQLQQAQNENTAQKNLNECLVKIKSALDNGKISRDIIRNYGKSRACELAKTLE